MHVHVHVPLYTCDIYTYMYVHVALAIYSRSPSAFEAVKHLGILQLPSTASLQAFMSLHQRSPGANEQQMALQHELYSQHVEKIAAEGRLSPKREGILIFDEVKVQGKVIWNSKNNQILGLAMVLKICRHYMMCFLHWMKRRRFRRPTMFCNSFGEM